MVYNNRKATLGNRHSFYFTIYNIKNELTVQCTVRAFGSEMRCGKMKRKAIVSSAGWFLVRFRLLFGFSNFFFLCIYLSYYLSFDLSIFVSIHALLCVLLFVLPSHYFNFFFCSSLVPIDIFPKHDHQKWHRVEIEWTMMGGESRVWIAGKHRVWENLQNALLFK